jgi:hypothetical protein
MGSMNRNVARTTTMGFYNRTASLKSHAHAAGMRRDIQWALSTEISTPWRADHQFVTRSMPVALAHLNFS